MKIAALTYTFGTPKTEAGMHHMGVHGFAPSLVIAAPPVPLTFYHSKIRIAPRDIPSTPPKELAAYYGAEYHETPHNSQGACSLLRDRGIDVAVILGARILKKPLIESARIGILNMHPGKLPENRGLDNVKWAVLLGLPQGATAHLIDERIDAGRILVWKSVSVYGDDTLMDLHLRVQAAERKAMVGALLALESGDTGWPAGDGPYRHAVPPEQELDLARAFEVYKVKQTGL